MEYKKDYAILVMETDSLKPDPLLGLRSTIGLLNHARTSEIIYDNVDNFTSLYSMKYN